MPFIGSLEGTFGYGRGGSEPLNNNKLLVEGATYIPPTVIAIGGYEAALTPTGSAVDSQNNIYVVGTYITESGPLSPTRITLKNMSGYTQTDSTWTLPNTPSLFNNPTYLFLIKYNSDGIVQWALNIGDNIYLNESIRITIDSSDNIYLTGSYSGTPITGDPGLYLNKISGAAIARSDYYLPGTTLGRIYGYVAKYNSSGNVLWVTYIKPNTTISSTTAICTDICLVGSLIFVSGEYDTNTTDTTKTGATLGNVSSFTAVDSTRTLLPCLNRSAFVACWNTSGIAQYATIIRVYDSTTGSNAITLPLITTDGTSIYLSGTYTTSSFAMNINRPSSTGTSQVDTSNPAYTLPVGEGGFIVKYNTSLVPSGSIYIRTGTAGNLIRSIKANATGVYILVSSLSTSTTFYNASSASHVASLVKVTQSQVSDGLIKYNTSLICQWAAGFQFFGTSLFIDSSNNLYFSTSIGNASADTKIRFYNAKGNGQSLAYPYILTIPNFTTYTFIIKYSSTGQMMTGTFVQGTRLLNSGISAPVIVGFNIGINTYIFACGSYNYNTRTTIGTLWNATGNKQTITDPAYTLPCPWAVYNEYTGVPTDYSSGYVIKYRVEV